MDIFKRNKSSEQKLRRITNFNIRYIEAFKKQDVLIQRLYHRLDVDKMSLVDFCSQYNIDLDSFEKSVNHKELLSLRDRTVINNNTVNIIFGEKLSDHIETFSINEEDFKIKALEYYYKYYFDFFDIDVFVEMSDSYMYNNDYIVNYVFYRKQKGNEKSKFPISTVFTYNAFTDFMDDYDFNINNVEIDHFIKIIKNQKFKLLFVEKVKELVKKHFCKYSEKDHNCRLIINQTIESRLNIHKDVSKEEFIHCEMICITSNNEEHKKNFTINIPKTTKLYDKFS